MNFKKINYLFWKEKYNQLKDKLDGISTNKRFNSNCDEKELSLEDYLETKSTNNGDDDKKEKNRKQVRWKDFEEDKN